MGASARGQGQGQGCKVASKLTLPSSSPIVKCFGSSTSLMSTGVLFFLGICKRKQRGWEGRGGRAVVKKASRGGQSEVMALK